jgi:plasmid maintenance system antidote protein VapI
MYLSKFLSKFCVVPTQMAHKLEFNHNKIFRIIRHGHVPSLAIAIKIEDFTEKQVSVRDILEECSLIKQKKKKNNKNKKQKNSPTSD